MVRFMEALRGKSGGNPGIFDLIAPLVAGVASYYAPTAGMAMLGASKGITNVAEWERERELEEEQKRLREAAEQRARGNEARDIEDQEYQRQERARQEAVRNARKEFAQGFQPQSKTTTKTPTEWQAPMVVPPGQAPGADVQASPEFLAQYQYELDPLDQTIEQTRQTRSSYDPHISESYQRIVDSKWDTLTEQARAAREALQKQIADAKRVFELSDYNDQEAYRSLIDLKEKDAAFLGGVQAQLMEPVTAAMDDTIKQIRDNQQLQYTRAMQDRGASFDAPADGFARAKAHAAEWIKTNPDKPPTEADVKQWVIADQGAAAVELSKLPGGGESDHLKKMDAEWAQVQNEELYNARMRAVAAKNPQAMIDFEMRSRSETDPSKLAAIEAEKKAFLESQLIDFEDVQNRVWNRIYSSRQTGQYPYWHAYLNRYLEGLGFPAIAKPAAPPPPTVGGPPKRPAPPPGVSPA